MIITVSETSILSTVLSTGNSGETESRPKTAAAAATTNYEVLIKSQALY